MHRLGRIKVDGKVYGVSFKLDKLYCKVTAAKFRKLYSTFMVHANKMDVKERKDTSNHICDCSFSCRHRYGISQLIVAIWWLSNDLMPEIVIARRSMIVSFQRYSTEHHAERTFYFHKRMSTRNHFLFYTRTRSVAYLHRMSVRQFEQNYSTLLCRVRDRKQRSRTESEDLVENSLETSVHGTPRTTLIVPIPFSCVLICDFCCRGAVRGCVYSYFQCRCRSVASSSSFKCFPLSIHLRPTAIRIFNSVLHANISVCEKD